MRYALHTLVYCAALLAAADYGFSQNSSDKSNSPGKVFQRVASILSSKLVDKLQDNGKTIDTKAAIKQEEPSPSSSSSSPGEGTLKKSSDNVEKTGTKILGPFHFERSYHYRYPAYSEAFAKNIYDPYLESQALNELQFYRPPGIYYPYSFPFVPPNLNNNENTNANADVEMKSEKNSGSKNDESGRKLDTSSNPSSSISTSNNQESIDPTSTFNQLPNVDFERFRESLLSRPITVVPQNYFIPPSFRYYTPYHSPTPYQQPASSGSSAPVTKTMTQSNSSFPQVSHSITIAGPPPHHYFEAFQKGNYPNPSYNFNPPRNFGDFFHENFTKSFPKSSFPNFPADRGAFSSYSSPLSSAYSKEGLFKKDSSASRNISGLGETGKTTDLQKPQDVIPISASSTINEAKLFYPSTKSDFPMFFSPYYFRYWQPYASGVFK